MDLVRMRHCAALLNRANTYFRTPLTIQGNLTAPRRWLNTPPKPPPSGLCQTSMKSTNEIVPFG